MDTKFYQIFKFLVTALTSLFLNKTIFAQEVDFTLEKLKSKNPQSQEIHFYGRVDENHYLNTQAPSKLNYQIDNKSTESKIQVYESHAEFSLPIKVLNQKNCNVSVELYICDKAKTYCVPKTKEFTCLSLKSLPASAQEIKIEPSAKLKNKNSASAFEVGDQPKVVATNFFHNDPVSAFAVAKKLNKPLLIDFYGVWCPPCNVLDETVFNQKAFLKEAQNYIVLKMDADLKSAWSLKSQFGIKYLPTVVFATADQEELERFVGAESLDSVIGKMKKIIKNKEVSLVKKIEKVRNNRDADLALEVANYYRVQENYKDAIEFYTIASRSKKFSDQDQDHWQWLTLKYGIENSIEDKKSEFFDLVLESYKTYPYFDSSYSKLEYLKSESRKKSEAQDDTYRLRYTKAVLAATDAYFKQNKKIKINQNNFVSPSTLYFFRADAFEALENTEETKKSFLQAAEALENEIKLANLEPQSARGFNLDRLYALYKAHKFEKAYELCESYQKMFPDDFTFYLGHARALKHEKKMDLSLQKAKLAYEKSYGDNKLRVTFFLAELLKELKQSNEAKKIIDEVISQAEAPMDETLSTFKHLAKLKKLKEQL